MPPRLRILQFNIQWGMAWNEDEPERGPVNLEHTAAEIRRVKPDVVFLQEVERVPKDRRPRLPPPNFSRLRELLPGFHAEFAYPPADPRELPFGYGLAVFAKTPLSLPVVHHLPAPAIRFPFQGREMEATGRIALECRTEWEGLTIRLLNVHLQAFFIINTSSDAHPEQKNRLLEILRGLPGPTVLAGDLNSAPDESILDDLAAAGFTTAQNRAVTWKHRPYVLDHILPNRFFKVATAAIETPRVSDHEMLLADLTPA